MKERLVEIDGDVTIDASVGTRPFGVRVIVWTIGKDKVKARHIDRAISKVTKILSHADNQPTMGD